MSRKVSVLIPTRGRPERLRAMLASYERMTAGYEHLSEIVLRADDDDQATLALLPYLRTLPYIRLVIVGSRLNGYGSMASFFNEMTRVADGDLLMLGNDDMVFRTLGWAARILAKADEFPDGIFNIGVHTFNEGHFPFSIVSKRAVRKIGFLWDPRLFWGDVFLRDVMGALGRCVMLPEVEVEHDWAGHSPDSTFLEANQQDIFRRDPSYWERTHALAVAEAVRKLQEPDYLKRIHVCVPVLKRYDLLRNMLLSLDAGTVRPTKVVVVDNGRNHARMAAVRAEVPCDVYTPSEPMGLAESWNWFIDNVPEERVIVNDDIEFGPQSLEKLVSTEGEFVSGLAGSNACSCFVLRDSCVERVGRFDEAISPGYAYFEDCDYIERMMVAQPRVHLIAVECGVTHKGSQTTASYSPQEWGEHHRRFLAAQDNFVRKWGRMPDLSRVVA